MLIDRNNPPFLSRCKVNSIMPVKFHWSTVIQRRNGYVAKISRDMSLLLAARLMDT